MKISISAIVFSSLLAAVTTHAAIAIDTVFVDSAGNSSDTPGYGSVSYDYHIGAYAVTNAQYAFVLNSVATSDPHGLYNTNMGTNLRGGIIRNGSSGSYTYSVKDGFANKPVNYVSFWDAARFSNWLTSGDTEVGVYNLGGVTNPPNNSIPRDSTAWANGGVAIASENEWYKAAYYDPTLTTKSPGDNIPLPGGYWLYPTQSNTITTVDANYGDNSGMPTDVGLYSHAPSYYGTFDQGGNVWEWNDETLSATFHGIRGGGYDSPDFALASSHRVEANATNELNNLGFRVSSFTPIPEPSTYAALFGLVAFGFVCWRRRAVARR